MLKPVIYVILSSLLMSMFSCNPDPGSARENEYADDPHSFARPEKAVVNHMSMDLVIGFEEHILKGRVNYDILNQNAHEIILDTKNLVIEKVLAGGSEAGFRLGDKDEILGRSLSIDIQPETESITVFYHTTDQSEALQWLEPEQTHGKTDPFLFTQGFAILTRSWIPIQDSPQIKVTYDAKVQVPAGLMAVMSAENPTSVSEEGSYYFRMPQPVSPYLIALAAGNIELRSISKRTGVYAEPAILDAAAYEFADLEKMLATAENLFGPYAWNRCDVLILPPSFPYGGMENPRLIFLTPTIISGDKSLTSLVAHEIAHAWSGNLVTCATADDFWLNEGLTVYIENRIIRDLYGNERADMQAVQEQNHVYEAIAEFRNTPERTALKLHMEGKNPEDANTDIAYSKGFLLFRTLEEAVGRSELDTFLREYFRDFAFSSLTTEDFISYLKKHLFEKQRITFNTDEWIYGQGLPENAVVTVSARFSKIEQTLASIMETGQVKKEETENWSSQEWVYFLSVIPPEMPSEILWKLDSTFRFTGSSNAVILSGWYEQAIRHQYHGNGIDEKIDSFLKETGRPLLIIGIYKAFMDTGQENTARMIYEEARPMYHYTATHRIDQILNRVQNN